MARKVTQLVEIIDDLDSKPIDEGMEQTIEFSWEGKDYAIDLRPTNAEKLDKLIKPYVEAATEIGRVSKRRSKSSAGTGTRAPSGSGRSSEELEAIRTWLRANGHTVGNKGRIKASLVEEFDAAHKS
ncbi:Lsr2 family protein [Rhodococcus sp. IEGM 1374]|uniref:histone-like nucleoid-structuring protein Lsr2 n=1 Tax=Rhodococcus sp. IEGM 1374 TaxID=3082221 RepID=UPI002952DD1F|nr:Lsr2 family protein [Rhodococcus sp. IEGM 1374]MDV7990491.1 Lsr2 family protein [Rhodococcus sp. IEGM 1374]